MKSKKLVAFGLAIAVAGGGRQAILAHSSKALDGGNAEKEALTEAGELGGQEPLEETENGKGVWEAASNEKATEDGIKYLVLEDGSVAITGYAGQGGELTLPSEIEGRAVSRIGAGAFALCEEIVSVDIPDSVASIGPTAFFGCTQLLSAHLPSKLTKIEEETFSYCEKLNNVNIPEGVAAIEDLAFYFCESLAGIALPESLVSVGWQAFWNTGLKEVAIPKNLVEIEETAFNNCAEMQSITVEEGNTAYASQDGALYSKNMKKIIACPGGKTGSFTIAQGVTKVGKSCFDGCALEKVTLPKSLKYIEDYGFSGCWNMESIVLSEGLKSIGSYAFLQCSRLKALNLPEGLKSIGVMAFSDCRAMKRLTIPKSVTKIQESQWGGGLGYSGALKVYRGSYGEKYAKKKGLEYTYVNCASCKYKKTVTKATQRKNGSVVEECSVCGRKKKTVVYRPKYIKLSKTSFFYNGKAQKPSVAVRDSRGKKLAKGRDYTVLYPKGMKRIGSYTIKVKFKGNYAGTVKKKFKIKEKEV